MGKSITSKNALRLVSKDYLEARLKQLDSTLITMRKAKKQNTANFVSVENNIKRVENELERRLLTF